MPTPVSEQTLLEGSWHALAQAGRLLRSAVVLLESGDASTALALAMFGREELGRSRLLRKCYSETGSGRAFSAKDISKICSEHVAKQEASAFATVLKPHRDSQVGKALATMSLYAHTPTSDEYRQADEVLNAAAAAKQSRQPHDRHESRCDSLYVDLNDLGTDWKCPIDVSVDSAQTQINEAVSDYSHEYQRLTIPELWHPTQPQIRGAEMRDAKLKMTRPLEIPLPVWPKPIGTANGAEHGVVRPAHS